MVDNIGRKAGNGGHALLLHQQGAGVRLKQRLDVVQQGQFAVNGQQRSNHGFIHVIAGIANSHNNFKFFLIAGKETNQPFFAGKMDMFGGQELIHLRTFGAADFGQRFGYRAADFGKYAERTVFGRTILGFIKCFDAVIIQSCQQSLRSIVQIFEVVLTIGHRENDVMGVAVNTVKIPFPNIGNCFQQRVSEIAFVFVEGNFFTQGNNAAVNLQIGHTVYPGLACLMH